MYTIKIKNKIIGKNKPSYIIAEGGVNHNGDISLAKKLIDKAKEAGADAIKFQTFKAELLVTQKAKQAKYQEKNLNRSESQFEMLKKLELTEKDFKVLKKYCVNKNIDFLSTPHSDTWSVDVLEKLDIAAYKIGSGDLTNKPILNYIAKLNKPVILSSGMANMKEVKEGINFVKEAGNNQIIMLHCTTSYPCQENKVNLKAMETIEKEAGCLVGYSDHTIGLETPVIAACLGATMHEKHFTLNHNMAGPDHKASLEPKELKKMIKAIRFVESKKITDPYIAFDELNKNYFNLNKNLIETILGKSEKVPEPEEIEIAKVARKSVVAIADIKKGQKFTEKNIGIRRPGEGLAPKYLDEIINRFSKRNISSDEYIKRGDF